MDEDFNSGASVKPVRVRLSAAYIRMYMYTIRYLLRVVPRREREK